MTRFLVEVVICAIQDQIVEVRESDPGAVARLNSALAHVTGDFYRIGYPGQPFLCGRFSYLMVDPDQVEWVTPGGNNSLDGTRRLRG
jgi:hypothetical protein